MKKAKSIIIAEYELPVVIDQDEVGGYVATCPLWNDCFAQGDSVEEALSEVTAVAASLIDLYKEEKMQIPLKKKHVEERDSKKLTFNLPLIVSNT